MNNEDLQAREIVRQARPLSQGSRLNGAAAAGLSLPAGGASTQVLAGRVQRLFVPDFDPLDDGQNFYLGDAPVYD